MRKILLLLILMFFGIVGYSQTNDTISNPLEKFFQENYDSTIIYYLKSNSEKNENNNIIDNNFLYLDLFVTPLTILENLYTQIKTQNLLLIRDLGTPAKNKLELITGLYQQYNDNNLIKIKFIWSY